MKKKIAMILTTAVLSLAIIGCGSTEAASQGAETNVSQEAIPEAPAEVSEEPSLVPSTKVDKKMEEAKQVAKAEPKETPAVPTEAPATAPKEEAKDATTPALKVTATPVPAETKQPVVETKTEAKPVQTAAPAEQPTEQTPAEEQPAQEQQEQPATDNSESSRDDWEHVGGDADYDVYQDSNGGQHIVDNNGDVIQDIAPEQIGTGDGFFESHQGTPEDLETDRQMEELMQQRQEEIAQMEAQAQQQSEPEPAEQNDIPSAE